MLQKTLLLCTLAVAYVTAGSLVSTIADKTIVELAVATPDLSTLVTALKAGGLVKTLEGKGPFTVFAPTNEAFAKLPAATLAHLLEPANVKELDAILTYHVVAGVAAFSKDLTDGEKIKTVEGHDVTAAIYMGDKIFINNALVTTADVGASNGVIHVIDTVLSLPVPKTIVDLAVATPDLSTLVTALKAGGLVDTLSGKGPFTVFAPTNEAFAKLPAATLAHLLEPANVKELDAILTYHVVSGVAAFSKDLTDGQKIKTVEGQDITVAIYMGDRIFINNALVTTADVVASNGVVHIVDAVLAFPVAPSNHLWFRGFTGGGFNIWQCGEVDAGPRMPDAIFDGSNRAALQAYEDITLALFSTYPLGDKADGDVNLELGRCADKNYTSVRASGGVNWAPNQLMDGICAKQCSCDFCRKEPSQGFPQCPPSQLPKCADQPDDPAAQKWCSLCGPKYNKPIEIKLFGCGNRDITSCPHPDARTPVADWARVVKDLLAEHAVAGL